METDKDYEKNEQKSIKDDKQLSTETLLLVSPSGSEIIDSRAGGANPSETQPGTSGEHPPVHRDLSGHSNAAQFEDVHLSVRSCNPDRFDNYSGTGSHYTAPHTIGGSAKSLRPIFSSQENKSPISQPQPQATDSNGTLKKFTDFNNEAYLNKMLSLDSESLPTSSSLRLSTRSSAVRSNDNIINPSDVLPASALKIYCYLRSQIETSQLICRHLLEKYNAVKQNNTNEQSFETKDNEQMDRRKERPMSISPTVTTCSSSLNIPQQSEQVFEAMECDNSNPDEVSLSAPGKKDVSQCEPSTSCGTKRRNSSHGQFEVMHKKFAHNVQREPEHKRNISLTTSLPDSLLKYSKLYSKDRSRNTEITSAMEQNLDSSVLQGGERNDTDNELPELEDSEKSEETEKE